MILDDPIERLPGIGPKRAAQLANLGVFTLRDLLWHFPHAYQDRRHITPIASVEKGMEATVQGEVVSARNIRLRRNMNMAVIRLRDESGEINATFFGRGFLANAFQGGAKLILTGRVEAYKGLSFKNPEYEVLSGDEEDRLNTGRIVPVYRLTEGVTQRMLRRWITMALGEAEGIVEDALPAALRQREGYDEAGSALREAHFPATPEAADAARSRFAYEELLVLQLCLLAQRAARMAESRGIQHVVGGPVLRALRDRLPFQLTAAQRRAVEDILSDMASPRPMLRLVQGDVGCGKTVVALHAIAAAIDGGCQAALMAPTEVLAEQHYIGLRPLLEPLGVSVELLTGAMRGAGEVRKRIALGEAQLVVGTHALIQENTQFHRLGLAIIDEQHRFGVMQRARLVEKGDEPDTLHMTATPIPRTLAITLYGGMDITVIDELPPGRRPVKTRCIPSGKISGLYDYIKEQARQGAQAYIICPLVDESDTKQLKSAIGHFEELSTGPLAGVPVALLHGRLDPREKEDALRRFQHGEIRVLFSTTVIEVGIDVPSATLMVIEDAPQFGLTQLHQLRGRVGRGEAQSFCFLLGTPTTEEGRERLRILCEKSSGFDIAEEDLRLRGPGEFHGVRQAGLSDLRAADLLRDVRLLDRARRDAQALLETDPRLDHPEHLGLLRAITRYAALRA